MFVFFDSQGHVANYIQPMEIRELMLDASEAYWLGSAGFANLEWRSFGDQRLLQLFCIPSRGFHLVYSSLDMHLVPINDPALGGLDEIASITVGMESIPVERREVVSRTQGAEIAFEFLSTGLPHAGYSWERRGEPFDLATLGLTSVP